MTANNDVCGEDDVVLVEGSALHEYLSTLGYRDFGCTSTQCSKTEQRSVSTIAYFETFLKRVYKTLGSIYSWIMQESTVSERHLSIIFNAETLLDDHATTIQGMIERYPCKSLKISFQEILTIGTAIIPTTCMLYSRQRNILALTLTSSIIVLVGYMVHLRLHTCETLKRFLSLQNNLYRLSKKGLKILRYNFEMKPGQGKYTSQFHELMGDRLKYVQPLTISLLNYLENISETYYSTSLILCNMLPSDIVNAYPITKFELSSFKLRGEISYRALTQLYNAYILVQSEMLQLLAVAYDVNTYSTSCSGISETKLAHVISLLTTVLTVHEEKLSRSIDGYCNCEIKPIRYDYRGPTKSKWKDLYAHLDLTAYKIQSAYTNVLGIIKVIDAAVDGKANDNELAATITQKLDDTCKEIDTARNFAEFCCLLTAKTRLNDSKTVNLVQDAVAQISSTSEARVVFDAEPEIVDEVFEEYIKEEYLKPLYDESDEPSLQDHRLDKLLKRNFMTELKEALIEKHKYMAEREARALERARERRPKSSAETKPDDSQRVPTPPPVPTLITPVPTKTSLRVLEGNAIDFSEAITEKQLLITQKRSTTEELYKNERDDSSCESELESNVLKASLPPCVDLENTEPFTAIQGILTKPPSLFLSGEEETFVGSGENSEEELAESSCDGDDVKDSGTLED